MTKTVFTDSQNIFVSGGPFKIISENSRKFNFRDENDQTYK